MCACEDGWILIIIAFLGKITAKQNLLLALSQHEKKKKKKKSEGAIIIGETTSLSHTHNKYSLNAKKSSLESYTHILRVHFVDTSRE
jgi:hypothetical protein